MNTKFYYLLIMFLIALLVVPTMGVTVNETEFLIDDTRYEFDKKTYTAGTTIGTSAQFMLQFIDYKDIANIQTVFWRPHPAVPNFVLYDEAITSDSYNVQLRTYSSTGKIIGSGRLTYFKGATTEQSHVRIDVYNIDTNQMTSARTYVMPNDDKPYNLKTVYGDADAPAPQHCLRTDKLLPVLGTTEIEYTSRFTHLISLVDYTESSFKIIINRDGIKAGSTDGKHSTVSIYDKLGNLLHTDIGSSTVSKTVAKNLQPYTVIVASSAFNKTYVGYLGNGEPWRPPGEEPLLSGYRKGSVTMTDHNGTTITGFEVTAVNHYTGEEYTVSTDTDVAVMELPMDRTIEIRNPQTGVYEEAPVGYYRFYGQKPGYKMLNEEGIKVSVMPEKYGTYKLCDILVSSDSGPLTGKHQFQIRSRSDFGILQTGTINAKSRTTGIWYNTTVTNGIATLVLPYDTSDALSEHAGHYYVYATSPGYEDSDYGTQIIVTPQTVSEVRTILLTPIGGVPSPGNVTLRIQALSETGQGVANAEIFIAGTLGAGKDVWDTYTASSTGYLAVSVPGNSTYDIVARGVGYYDSSRRVQVFTEDPDLIEIRLYLSGAPTLEPTTEPTGWVTGPPTTQPTSGIPDEDDGSGGFLMEAVRGIGNAFGVGFATAKIILGMLLALSIGFATAKQLRGGAAEFGLGLLGGTMLGILVGLIPVWTIVVLLLVVGLYIGNRYVGGGNNG